MADFGRANDDDYEDRDTAADDDDRDVDALVHDDDPRRYQGQRRHVAAFLVDKHASKEASTRGSKHSIISAIKPATSASLLTDSGDMWHAFGSPGTQARQQTV